MWCYFKVLHLASLRMLYLRQTLDLPKGDLGAVRIWPLDALLIRQAPEKLWSRVRISPKWLFAAERGIHRKDRLGFAEYAFRMCLSQRGIEESYKITTSCVSATEAVAWRAFACRLARFLVHDAIRKTIITLLVLYDCLIK